MSALPGRNEDHHILAEFVCEAIPVTTPPGESAPGRGKCEEIRILQEAQLPVLDISGVTVQLANNTAVFEIVINQEFQSYSQLEQERLLEAIRQLLGTPTDIHVLKKRKG